MSAAIILLFCSGGIFVYGHVNVIFLYRSSSEFRTGSMSIHDDDTRMRFAQPYTESGSRTAALTRHSSGFGQADQPWDPYEDNSFQPVSVLKFFLKYLKSPTTVGAIAPSGQSLAALITSETGPETGPVLELGAGDGIFTGALLKRGIAPENVVAVELEAGFAKRLVKRFPDIKVVNAAAEEALASDGLGYDEFGAVISGLPLLNFPWSVRHKLLSLIFQRLKPGAALYQFTYGLSAPVPKSLLKSVGLREEFLGRVFRNVPPAAVYKITRR